MHMINIEFVSTINTTIYLPTLTAILSTPCLDLRKQNILCFAMISLACFLRLKINSPNPISLPSGIISRF